MGNFLNRAKGFFEKNSSTIAIVTGAIGLIVGGIMAAKATPKALNAIENKKENLEKEELTPKETIQTVWKYYIPAIVSDGLSIGLIVAGLTVNEKKNTALTAAYTISETALQEYQDKVIEKIGKKKNQEIHDEIAKDHIEENPVNDKQVIITRRGETLCYESISGRYFKSDIETIRQRINELNSEIIQQMYVSLNDVYYSLELPSLDIGERLGWNVDNGLIEVEFSSQLASDGTPCLVLQYLHPPKYGFRKLY